jgi:uncharacterized membrane protein YqjE
MAQPETSRPAGSDQSLGDLVALAAKDISQLIRGEISLAKIELKADLKRIAVTAGMAAVLVFFGFFLLLAGMFAAAYGLANIPLPLWAAWLIVLGICFLFILLAGLVAFVVIRRVTGLRTTRTSVQETVTALRSSDKQPEITAPSQR